jgi:hypothetical protein
MAGNHFQTTASQYALLIISRKTELKSSLGWKAGKNSLSSVQLLLI